MKPVVGESSLIDRTIAGYEVLDELGMGGMGRIYKAKHIRLNRLVALKILLPKASGERGRRRFLQEARAASALDHPGIVTIHDIVTHEDSDVIVMELVEGESLDKRIPSGGLPWHEAVELALELSEALAVAHGAGIVHRDLKPANVMVTQGSDGDPATRAGRGRTKLLDFGIAKLQEGFDENTRRDSTLTREGAAPGTMAYMSPEQALGEPVDQRSDIFSLGVLLYEMLTGCRPFQGETMPALARQLIFADPKSPRQLRQDVPERLEAVVLRALSKKPEDRYPAMGTLAADLRQCQQRDELPARPPRVSTRRWRPILLLSLAALGVGLGYPLISSSLRPPTVPHTETALRSPSPALPQTAYEHYQTGMGKLARFDREGYIDGAIEDFEAAIAQHPEYAPAFDGLARAKWRKFRAKRDPLWLQQATQHARRALELEPLLADAAVTLARILTVEGKQEAAQEELERVRTLHPNNANALAALAELAFLREDLATALRLNAQATRLEPENWELYSDLGRFQLSVGELAAAEAAFRQSLELVPDHATNRRNLGAVLHYQGRYAEAVTELQTSITIRPTAHGYANLGTAYFFQGRYQEAAVALEAARERNANNFILWANLGDAYRQLPGRDQDAILCFKRAIQLLKPRMTADPPDPTQQSRLALYLAKADRFQAAVREIAGVEPLANQASHVAFRATVVYELAGERQQALSALGSALEGGYPMIEILNEPELVRLREDVAFHQLAVRFDMQIED